MDDGIERRAALRFEALRDNALRLLDEAAADAATGGTPATVPGIGAPPPDGWCVSSVARLATNEEPGGDAGEGAGEEPGRGAAAVAALQRRLDAVGRWRHYPAAALHVSLLGCTRREPERQDGDLARLERIARCVEEHRPPVTPLRLGRVNLVGAQAFVEAVPLGGAWAQARRHLADALRSVGEEPLSHPDAEPVHLNVSRLQRLDDPAALRDLLADPAATVGLVVQLRVVEVVVTDFVLDPDATTVIATLPLLAATP